MKHLMPALALSIATCVVSTPVFAIPYCSSTEQVNCAKYVIEGKDCHQTESEGFTQCIDVSQRGMEIIQARVSSDREVAENQERCPQGYQQSEQKCSNEERRRGCKDIRLDSGMGCVRR